MISVVYFSTPTPCHCSSSLNEIELQIDIQTQMLWSARGAPPGWRSAKPGSPYPVAPLKVTAGTHGLLCPSSYTFGDCIVSVVYSRSHKACQYHSSSARPRERHKAWQKLMLRWRTLQWHAADSDAFTSSTPLHMYVLTIISSIVIMLNAARLAEVEFAVPSSSHDSLHVYFMLWPNRRPSWLARFPQPSEKKKKKDFMDNVRN